MLKFKDIKWSRRGPGGQSLHCTCQ